MTKLVAREETIEATETLLEIKVSYPEAIPAAHKEILRLKSLLLGAREVISERDAEISGLQSEVDDLQEEVKAEEKQADENLVTHVNQFLDECERVEVNPAKLITMLEMPKSETVRLHVERTGSYIRIVDPFEEAAVFVGMTLGIKHKKVKAAA